MVRKRVENTELKNNIETSEIQETDLKEISSGSSIQDINKVDLFQSA